MGRVVSGDVRARTPDDRPFGLESKAGYRSVPIPMKVAPVLAARIVGQLRGAWRSDPQKARDCPARIGRARRGSKNRPSSSGIRTCLSMTFDIPTRLWPDQPAPTSNCFNITRQSPSPRTPMPTSSTVTWIGWQTRSTPLTTVHTTSNAILAVIWTATPADDTRHQHSYCAQFRRHFPVHTPITTPAHPRIQAK